LELLLEGRDSAYIRDYASENDWKVSDRQIRRYLQSARRKAAETVARDREELIGRHLVERRVLYAKAVKANDLAVALRILRDEAQLCGLYPDGPVSGDASVSLDVNIGMANQLRQEMLSDPGYLDYCRNSTARRPSDAPSS